MRRVVYVTVALPAAIIVIGLLSLVVMQSSVAQSRVGPPPAKATNMPIGFPAIAPHLNLDSPGKPAFTADDLKFFISQHGSPAGPLVKGAHLTFLKILFITSQEASTIMGGESTGLPGNALVCYVVIHGPFVMTNAHISPAAHITQPPIVTTTEIVFDARTGNLLVWGAPAAGY